MGGKVIEINDTATFRAKVEQNKSQAIAPIIERMSEQYSNMLFVKVDVDKARDLAAELGVSAMPTFFLFWQGNKVDTKQGADPNWLKQMAEKYNEISGPFQGSGQKLGGNNGAAPSPSGAAANTAATGADPSQPTTHIQVRMSDGSKLKGTFNLSQTVGDIRKFVEQSHPGMGSGFELKTQYPSTTLTDPKQTLQDAQLENALVIQS
eukprot:jgi/Astpho2/8730/Aster-x1540